MATLVHITDEKYSKRIKESGISLGKDPKVVYFMPVTQNHLISHQWIRELKRWGVKNFIGVYFKIPNDEIVWSGHYNQEHTQKPLRDAIQELESLEDPLGYEIFIERKITSKEITKIRSLPSKIGWRYRPHIHGEKPCPCPMCLVHGSYSAKKIKDKYNPKEAPEFTYLELKDKIISSNDSEELKELFWALGSKVRKDDPSFFERLFSFNDDDLLEEVANTLMLFKHPKTKNILLQLCRMDKDDIKVSAVESLYHLYKKNTLELLEDSLLQDPIIKATLIEEGAYE